MNEAPPSRQRLAERIQAKHAVRTRNRRVLTGVFIVAAALVGVVALVAMQLRPDTGDASASAPRHATSDYGFTLTPELAGGTTKSSPIAVSVYEDFLCDSCQLFHEQSSEFLAEQARTGAAVVTYHPFAFLRSEGTANESLRAANAAVCVADELGVEGYLAMQQLLFAERATASEPVFSDDRLSELAVSAGATQASECISELVFKSWLDEGLAHGIAAEVTSTPTVRVEGATVVKSTNGVETMPGPEELRVAIEAMQ